MPHAGITVIMVSNMHSCQSTERMPWLVIFTDQSTSQLSPWAVLKSSCSQWTRRHEKAVDVATMSISQSVRRSDPQSILLRGQKREVFALSATYPLIEVLLKKNRSIWHPLLEKNRPKAKAKDTVSSFPKTGKQHLTLWLATHLPRSNHRLLWAAIMHTPHSLVLCEPGIFSLQNAWRVWQWNFCKANFLVGRLIQCINPWSSCWPTLLLFKKNGSAFRQMASSGTWHTWWSRLAKRRTFLYWHTTGDYHSAYGCQFWR